MRKLVIAVLVGTFCLGATNTFAQTKKETPQEKIMRLEIENKVRQELMDSLSRKVATLEAELKESKQQAAAKQNTAPALKPYYATLEVQQKCEQYSMCAKWAKEQYELMKCHNDPFKITDVKEDKYFKEPKTIHKLHLRINGLSSSLYTAVFTRTGLGTDPLSWEEEIWSPRFNSQMYCFKGIK